MAADSGTGGVVFCPEPRSRLIKPGPGRKVDLLEPLPRCPVCLVGVGWVRLECGWRYDDPGFDTARYGTWEELGAAEPWEQAWPCADFDRLVTDCGHQSRGVRAAEWLAHLQRAPVLPVLAAERQHLVSANRRATVPLRAGGNRIDVRFEDAAPVLPVTAAAPPPWPLRLPGPVEDLQIDWTVQD